MSADADPPWVLDYARDTPWMNPRTAGPPGVSGLEIADWTVRGPDYDAQMTYRKALLSERPEAVMSALATGEDAGLELLSMVLTHLGDTNPDGSPRELTLKEMFCPFSALNNLVAEDWCIMLPDEEAGEYKLVAAILCFPAGWKLAEKVGRPMWRIHLPVEEYDETLGRRVKRMFDTLRADRPLVRCNWLIYTTPELFLPFSEADKSNERRQPSRGYYVRTERQSLVRLPESGAVAFGIRTSICPLEVLTPKQADGMHAALLQKNLGVQQSRIGEDRHTETLRRLEALAAG